MRAGPGRPRRIDPVDWVLLPLVTGALVLSAWCMARALSVPARICLLAGGS